MKTRLPVRDARREATRWDSLDVKSLEQAPPQKPVRAGPGGEGSGCSWVPVSFWGDGNALKWIVVIVAQL